MTNEDINRISQYHDDGNQRADECSTLGSLTIPIPNTLDETEGKSSSELSKEEKTATTTTTNTLTTPPAAATLPASEQQKDQPSGPTTNRSLDVAMMMENDAEPTKRSLLTIIHMILVVVASSTINGVVFGVVNNFGVFYVYLIELFKQNKGLLVWNAESADIGLASNATIPSDTFLQPLIGM